MVYNSQGNSRGMAIVSFTRQGDAAVARAKYNGKIVDGREFYISCERCEAQESVNVNPPPVSAECGWRDAILRQ